MYPVGAGYSIECFFERGMRFKPDDGMVRMVYGIYLSQSGNIKKAITQIVEADRLEPNNSNINYNLGLLYLKNKDYEKAIYHAKIAYGLGFSLPGLRDMLIKSGRWDGSIDK
jgi:tetratricopeptide (TPR) repeat protein